MVKAKDRGRRAEGKAQRVKLPALPGGAFWHNFVKGMEQREKRSKVRAHRDACLDPSLEK